jgi:hypothetical protein
MQAVQGLGRVFHERFLSNLASDLKYIRSDINRKAEAEVELYHPKSNVENYTRQQYTQVKVGELRLQKIIHDLVEMFKPFTRFRFQETLHSEVLRSVLNNIIDTEEERRMVLQRVLETYGWAYVTRNMLAIASRRSGKTTGMASVVAALLLHCPGLEVISFSVSLQNAEEFIRLAHAYIIAVLGPGSSRIRFAADSLRIIHPNGKISRLICRGSGGVAHRVRSFPLLISFPFNCGDTVCYGRRKTN